MRLPEGDRAIIDQRKLTEYCLSIDHDEGQHKAYLFRNVLGITTENASLLVEALQRAAANDDAINGNNDKYGQRFVIDFELTGPLGSAMVRSAWIIRTGEQLPRLVTCYIL